MKILESYFTHFPLIFADLRMICTFFNGIEDSNTGVIVWLT